MLRLSILDQSPIYDNETALQAFQRTILLAQEAEKWGYHRFWVSEHHDSDQVAGSSPEVLISHLLAKTERIRIGSGGVMLQHYSPYKVAENFHVLESLAPNRVDLGIGRAPGGLPHSTKALQQGNDMRPLFEKLIELEQFLHDKLEPTHPLHGLKAQPIPRYPLHIYLLGASTSSASVAANLGFSYVFAQFINSDENTIAEAFKTYQKNFNMEKGTPHSILAVSLIVTDTDEEAKELAADAKIVKIHLESGKTLTLPSVEKAEEYGKQAGENYTITIHDANIIHGSQETVRNTLLTLQQTYHLEEFIITTPIKDFNKRLYSYKILKDAFSELIPR